ncbi:MAG: SpoIIE family protein phosphatase [Candidatus Cloacimonetes bacterium]|nr:SpoIIE family protein phosphatase [Candidatus Cloacimonadota bacterium]
MELPIKILIVDDDLVVINIIRNILKQNAYLTDFCFSGEDALEKIHADRFDLVLLDVYMGKGMDGYETCAKIRALQPKLPVILVTAMQDDESVNKGFEAGSSDYIKKPVSKLELLARVNNIITYKRAEQRNLQLIETLQKDLKTAANIQRAMLPKWVYLDKQMLISSFYEPSESVGGDLFDKVRLSESKYVVYIGDISGHGVQAALLMTALKSVIKLMIETFQEDWNLADLFNRLNELFYEELSLRHNYLTLLMCVVDLAEGELRILNAGHPPLIRISGLDKEVEVLNKKGSLPLGWLEEENYRQEDIERIPLTKEDIFLLYTDGIYECNDQDNNMFGLDGLERFLNRYQIDDICLPLPYKIREHLDENGFETTTDDFSLLAFQLVESDESRLENTCKYRHHIFLRSALKGVGKTAMEGEKMVLHWTGDDTLAAKAELIIDEFLNNIICYGYQNESDAEIIVALKICPHRLYIQFWDKGIAWDPEDVDYSVNKPYDFDQDLLGTEGRGLKMITSLSNGFNRLRYADLNETKVEIIF